ncbi:MAG: [FeFe] hydrogenase H-cluster maturation GTPase HydF [Clostridia bacterium]|nr:[FeFe] hydrogenase H-cluster maturation GTPase HydF [Clostridia bacterium]
MELNKTPASGRINISFFGKTNAGKSSLVNAFTGQDFAIVSDVKGTTTDPNVKAMELLPLGPVLICDTPGYDDFSVLGEKRIAKTKQVLRKTDIAILVTESLSDEDKAFIKLFKENDIPFIVAYSKSDILKEKQALKENEIYVSSKTGENINTLKEMVAKCVKTDNLEINLVGDFAEKEDLFVLVTPIDEAAPKGRLILPQQQTIRDILDHNAVCLVTKETQLEHTLKNLGVKPKAVITDSQAFGKVAPIVPKDINLTSFSILMAKYKGFLETAVKGISVIDTLNDGDKILISEGCTHHRQCGDIGSVKIPALLKKYTGKSFEIVLSSGSEFPEDLTPYKLIIHCGGCMLNNREMKFRMNSAIKQNVPFTNYGIALSYMNGILKRSLSVFPDIQKLIEE